jgi:hypothetical protein
MNTGPTLGVATSWYMSEYLSSLLDKEWQEHQNFEVQYHEAADIERYNC